MKTGNKNIQFTEPDNCLHCEFVNIIAHRLEAGEVLTPATVIEALVTTLCEFLAAIPEKGMRRTEIKNIAQGIPILTEECRKIGQYPGGPNYGQALPEPNADAPDTLQ